MVVVLITILSSPSKAIKVKRIVPVIIIIMILSLAQMDRHMKVSDVSPDQEFELMVTNFLHSQVPI